MEIKKGWNELSLDVLNQCDWNYKGNDKKTMRKLVENIRKNGLVENLITYIDDENKVVVLNGNHRLQALKELEHKTAHCFHMGRISEKEAKRLAIETNETKFTSDSILLSGLINELTLEFDIEELELTMPYSIEQIENYQKLEEFDWEDHDSKEIEEKIDKNAKEQSLSKIIPVKLTSKQEEKLLKIKEILTFQDEINYNEELVFIQLLERFVIEEINDEEIITKRERRRIK